MLRNTESKYGSLAKFLHWLIFLLIAGLVLVGFFWENTGIIKGKIINIHKLIGLLTFAIIVFRIYWAAINLKPQLPNAQRWEKIVEHAVHGCIYLLLIAMPLSGWIMATAAGRPPHIAGLALPMPGIPANQVLAGLANQAHELLAWTLIILVSLHVLAALKHHFINKDDVLKRMLPGN